jgi:monoamine oxidase
MPGHRFDGSSCSDELDFIKAFIPLKSRKFQSVVMGSPVTSFVSGRAPSGNSPKRVVIVGGGLAGLVCALRLREIGCEVVVLEGQERVGGRIESLRDGLDHDLVAEAGATRIPDKHLLTLRYVKEFGLSLSRFGDPSRHEVLRLRGQSYTLDPGTEPNWQLRLRAEERELGRRGLIARYLLSHLNPLADCQNSVSVPDQIAKFDGQSLSSFLIDQGLSSDAVDLLLVGRDRSVNAAIVLLTFLNEQFSEQYFHIRGGNDQLPKAIARQLGDQVRHGSKVINIGQDDTGAWAVVARDDRHEIIRGDHLVSTLPFSVCRNLFIDARLSVDKYRVIQELNYLPVAKIFLKMRSQFWKTQGYSGFAHVDLAAERFMAMGPPSSSERGLLFSYSVGDKAKQLSSVPHTQRVAQIISEAESTFPGARGNFEGALTKYWSEDPWQRGGLTGFSPSGLRSISTIAKKEHRIHFAGEHTSRWTGWMQGAIESAHRVIEEISQ